MRGLRGANLPIRISSLILLVLAISISGPSTAVPVRPEVANTRFAFRVAGHFTGVGRMWCADRANDGIIPSIMTVVGDRRTVVGAGHFLQASAIKDGKPRLLSSNVDSCTFQLFNYEGDVIFSSGIESLITGEKEIDVYRTSSFFHHDWAVVTLAQEVPAYVKPIRIHPVDHESVDTIQGALLVSVSKSPPYWHMVSEHCSVEAGSVATMFQYHIFRHNCNTEPGDSGALIITVRDGEPWAIGIHNGAIPDYNENFGQFFGEIEKALASK